MSDKPSNGTPEAAPAEQMAPLTINGQYVKDLSFESPNSPGILNDLQTIEPNVNVNVDVKANKIDTPDNDKLYEVILMVKAELHLNKTVGFIVELEYAGVFTLNLPEEHLSAMLLVECPRILFPYARNILSDVTRDGGFMPLFLQPIDFAGMYQARLQQMTETPETPDA